MSFIALLIHRQGPPKEPDFSKIYRRNPHPVEYLATFKPQRVASRTACRAISKTHFSKLLGRRLAPPATEWAPGLDDSYSTGPILRVLASRPTPDLAPDLSVSSPCLHCVTIGTERVSDIPENVMDEVTWAFQGPESDLESHITAFPSDWRIGAKVYEARTNSSRRREFEGCRRGIGDHALGRLEIAMPRGLSGEDRIVRGLPGEGNVEGGDDSGPAGPGRDFPDDIDFL